MFEIRRTGNVGGVQWMAIAGIIALCLVLVPASRAADYFGDGQSPTVNKFLNPEVLIVHDGLGEAQITVPITQKVNMVPQGQGGLFAEMQFTFGTTVDFTTFSTSIGTIANLSPRGVRVTDIPIGPARTTVVASIVGATREVGGATTDTDRIVLDCCVPESEKPPNADAGPDENVASGEQVFLDGSGSSDLNGDLLAYLWEQVSGPPVTLSSVLATMPSFSAPVTQVNQFLEFDLTVNDSIWISFPDRVMINVEGTDNLPAVASAGPDLVVTEGDAVALDGSGSFDPEGASISCSWDQTGGAPAATISNPNDCIALFTAPVVAAPSILTFTNTVTDDVGASGTDSANVTVRPPNNDPVADAGPDQVVLEGSPVMLSGTNSSDADGDPLTFSWRQTAGIAVTLQGTNSAMASFTSPLVDVNETLSFELTVTDDFSGLGVDTVDVTVSNASGSAGFTGLSEDWPVGSHRPWR